MYYNLIILNSIKEKKETCTKLNIEIICYNSPFGQTVSSVNKL